jgi:XRE family transcriptional regulator, fatty acid utilization regulator
MADNDDLINDYGKRLREIRSVMEMSQKDFAAQLGVSPSFLSELEIGKTKPGYNLLMKLTEKFDISPSWVLLGHGQMHLSGTDKNLKNEYDFGDQAEKIRDLLILFDKSPLVRNAVMAFASKYLLSNETIINRDISARSSRK